MMASHNHSGQERDVSLSEMHFESSAGDKINYIRLDKWQLLRLSSRACLIFGLILSTSESGVFAIGALLLVIGIGLGMFAEIE
jgi:VanZ family protein